MGSFLVFTGIRPKKNCYVALKWENSDFGSVGRLSFLFFFGPLKIVTGKLYWMYKNTMGVRKANKVYFKY